jgi:hypothetical protein
MSSIPTESSSQQVLVLESPRGLETMDLTRRLRELGTAATIATSFEEAQQLLREAGEDVGAILIPTCYETKSLKKTLQALLASGPPACISFVSVGDTPADSERKKLRRAGVKLALWNPISEANLRFQINRALHPDRNGFGSRDNPRVPAEYACTITVGERQKNATIYSLAETGAFLATPRASMNGARIHLELRLPGGPISTSAEVVYANVPGNLQRPGLPLGMGVHFDGLAHSDQKRLRSLIAECVEQLEV